MSQAGAELVVVARQPPAIRLVLQLAVTTATAWLGSTLAIVLAAWQAGRVSLADALRGT